MKNKLGKFLSILFIITGYLACVSWAVVELYKYYGWSSFANSSLFMSIYNIQKYFSQNGIAWFFTYFVGFALVLSLGVFSFKTYKESRLAYYKKHRVEIKVTQSASFYDKAYDEFTPVSAYSKQNDQIDLESQYDYLLNK